MSTMVARLRADERGEIAVSYLFVVAMSLLVLVAVMGMSVPIRTANEMTQTVLGENTP
jgi:Flp pilus assembly pilin Flp